MAIIKTSRKLHKWLMLFVGVQFLIWAATGLYMVAMNIDYIHGDSLVTNKHHIIDAKQVQFTLADLQQQFADAEQINLTMLQGKAVYQFKQGKKWRLVAAQTGELLTHITKAQAVSIAKSRYAGTETGTEKIFSSMLITEPNGEISPRILPAWQVNFDDVGAPRLYISAQTGELVTKRHDFWVLFDWMFRFHIMDYGEDEDSSNSLLLVIALISLLACIAGVVLTYVSFIKVAGKSIKPPKTNKNRIKNKKLKAMPWIRFLHRWFSLLVFVQLLIWISTGLYFNLMDHQKASGNQHRQRIVAETKQFANEALFPLTKVLQQYPLLEKISLLNRLGEPYYLLTFQQGLYSHFPRQQTLIDAKTGEVKRFDAEAIEQIALLSYKGNALINASQKIRQIEELPKQQNPLWQVNLNDKLNTSVYIDVQNASVIAHVDDDKRLADLMFKLHFMDYRILNNLLGSKTGGFNNAQVILLALLTLLFALTGVYWLLHLVKHKQFKIKA